MRVFLAGATGVIGVRLIPLLISAGHQVAGMTRSAARVERLRALGAVPVVCDVYDRDAVMKAVRDFRTECVLNELTDLPDDSSRIPETAPRNARIRREGNRNLLAAAKAAGVGRVLAQSVAWELPGEGGEAVRELEQSVLAAGGIVLRYGQFYGPGTYYEGRLPPPPRVQIDTAAARTVEALDAPGGVITIVDEV